MSEYAAAAAAVVVVVAGVVAAAAVSAHSFGVPFRGSNYTRFVEAALHPDTGLLEVEVHHTRLRDLLRQSQILIVQKGVGQESLGRVAHKDLNDACVPENRNCSPRQRMHYFVRRGRGLRNGRLRWYLRHL